MKDLLHAGDEHVNSLESKSFLTGPLLGQEPFKAYTAADPAKINSNVMH